MIGVRIWLRSTWKFLLPLMLLVQVMALMNVQGIDGVDGPGWSVDWSWMLSVWDGGTILLSPVAAAAVVLLIQRAWRNPTDELVGTLRRAPNSRADIAVAVALQGLLVQAVTLAGASAFCFSRPADASGLSLPWQLFTGPCALLAAVCLGAVVGEFVKDPWAVPVTAVGVFFFQRLFFWMGYPELLSTEMATGPVPGARPIPHHLMATCASNLFLALGCISLVVWHVRTKGQRHWPLLLVAAAAIIGVLAIFQPFVAAHALNTYEPR